MSTFTIAELEAAHKKAIYENREKFPSMIFGIHCGIENLYTDWKDTSIEADKFLYWKMYCLNMIIKYSKDSEEYLEGIKNELIVKMYNQIIVDNPILKDIEVNTARQKLDVVWGAVSKFTFEDIKFFVENRDTIGQYNIDNSEIKNKIKDKVGMYAHWVMSPTTIKYVLERI